MNNSQLKNLTIVILFVSSLILLSIRFELFTNTTSGASTDFDMVGVESTLKSSVRPSSIIIRYGTNNVTKVVDKDGFYYQEARNVLKDSLKEITGISEITSADYYLQKDFKSIQLDFEPTIDQRLLYGSLFLEDGRFGDFKNIREILIPLADDTSIYFKTEDRKFFRLKNKVINYMPYVDNLSTIKYSKYYSLGELFDSSSDVLISDSGVSLPTYSTEFPFDESNINSIIRSVFASRYDFANKISELDGTTIVSYDYGRELLKIAPNGKVNYVNSEALNNPIKTSMTNSLVIAYNFIDKFNVNNDIYVVENISEFAEHGTTGYTFGFTPRVNGLRSVLSPNTPLTTISVINGRVYNFEGFFRKIVALPTADARAEIQAPFSALDVINNNFNYLKARISFDDAVQLFDKISLIDTVYVFDDEFNYIPCYKMIINSKAFFFNIQTGEVIQNGLE